MPLRVDGKAGGVTITVLNEDRFVCVLPPQRILSDHGHTYASMVLSMKPVVYYRMEQPKEEKDRFTLFDSAARRLCMQIASGERVCTAVGAGPLRGLAFLARPDFDSDYVLVRDYPKASGERISASAWVWAESQL